MASDFKRRTRIELESELSAERAATRRSHALMVMQAVFSRTTDVNRDYVPCNVA